MFVAWDYETQPIEELPVYPPHPVGIALYKEGEKPEYLRWGHPDANNCTEEYAKDVLTRLWNDPTVELIAHHNPFDSYVAHMKWQLPLKAKGQMHDTLVMAFLWDPHAMTYALKPLSEKLLGMPPEESDRLREYCQEQGYIKRGAKQYGEYIWLCPGDMVGEYACGDVERTMKLFHYYKAKIEEAGMWDAYLREMKLQPIMLTNTRDGICVDVDGLTRDVAMYDNALAKIDELLFQMLGCEPFNINSDAQLADAIDKAHPGLVWTLTKTGKRSTSKANMERTLEGLTGKLLAVMQYRASMQTCVNTFLRPWLIQSTHPLGGGRIRCQWNTTRSDSGGARTGRLSSSPSFMNIPTLASAKFAMVLKLWEEWLKDDFPPLPNVRAYVMPDIDEELVSLDFASQELRVLAHYEDDLLLKAYKEDPTQDLHQFAADTIANVLGIPFKRKQAKTCAFAILYGSGLTTLASALGATKDEAGVIKNAYLDVLPGVKGLIEQLKARARTNQPLRTWGGRVYYVEPPRFIDGQWRSFEYKLLNYLIQSSSADITKTAIIEYAKRRVHGRFLLTVHDQIVVSVPTEHWISEAKILQDCMESIKLDAKLLADVSKGPNLHNVEDFKL